MQNNGANPVLGCYVAPSCLADTVKNESYIYLVDITADEIRHQLLFFQHTQPSVTEPSTNSP